MARNRIASLDPAASRGNASNAAPVVPAAPSDDFRAEVSSRETEQALNLSLADRREVQLRLNALAFDAGPANGSFGDKTRLALVAWQKKQGVTPTGWLGSRQLAALRAESESAYGAQSAAPAKVRAHAPIAPPRAAHSGRAQDADPAS